MTLLQQLFNSFVPVIRVVYKIVKTDNTMKIIIISARSDNEVYEIAYKRNFKR